MKDPDFDIENYLDDLDKIINGDTDCPEPRGIMVLDSRRDHPGQGFAIAMASAQREIAKSLMIPADMMRSVIEKSRDYGGKIFGTDPTFGIFDDLFAPIKAQDDFLYRPIHIDFFHDYSYGNCYHPNHGEECTHLWVNPSALHNAECALAKASCGFDILLDERHRWSVF